MVIKMARRSRSSPPTAQSEIDKYNTIKSHRRLGFTFDELEMLYFGEEGRGFPEPLRVTQRIWKNQRTFHGVLEVLKRYANKRPEEVRVSIRNFENQRETERRMRQLAEATERLAQAIMGPIPGELPMDQPQQGGFASNFGDQHPFGPQPGYQWKGPIMGNTAVPGPFMHGQMAQANGAAGNLLPLGVNAGLVDAFEHPATLTAQDNLHGGTPTPMELTPAERCDWLPEVPSDTRLIAPALTPDVSSREMSFDAIFPEKSPDSPLLPAENLNEEQSLGDSFALSSLEYELSNRGSSSNALDTAGFNLFDDLFTTESSSHKLDTIDINTFDEQDSLIMEAIGDTRGAGTKSV
ncbi:uncharacterized protein CC84DRAFT_934304 [Paraphaeosphaeria sporulosa]|uniref:Uncharacterized protein n=1 Tax=Paraphaeosphaeria sporulosa TaxID=1460663 RepID=A0A177C7K4_9PLEO|nr:uncharacterized protein CC84DRAFT_934304 [Paraphaeosphaeria sporulosa]OAG02832.1 hypothetical protein CC84DRAFT_934304 [Paraphaeosphaeria sporulosa]